MVSSLQVLDVWRDSSDRKVIHTFIETSMGGDLDAGSVGIVPEYISSSVWNVAEEDAFLGVRD